MRSSYLVRSVALSDCTYAFGCAGLSGKDFHILNEPYERAAYFETTRRLMRELGLQPAQMTDAVLEVLWKRVLDDFANDAAHGAFVEHCQLTNQLLEAAVRYRGMAGDHVRGAMAQQRLNGIAALAMATLEMERIPERTNAATIARIVAIVLFILGSAVLLFALNK